MTLKNETVLYTICADNQILEHLEIEEWSVVLSVRETDD
jgi:hypothetical protein